MKKFTFLFVFAFLASLILSNNAFGQITQVASPENSTSTSTSITIDRPSSLLFGDIMFATIVQTDDDGGTLSNASLAGWTVIDGRVYRSNGNDEWWVTLLYKIATNADVVAADFTFTLDSDANDGNIGAIVAFHGVDISSPFDILPGIFNVVASSDDLSATSITTATANAAVVMFGVNADDENFSAWQTATGPLTLSNESFDEISSTGPDKSIGAAWAIKAIAGATGTGTAEISDNDNNANGAILIALKPTPAIPANLWGIQGSNVVNFSVSAGIDVGSGPTTRFAQTIGTSSAALARTNKPTLANGYFYWLLNSSPNAGVVQVYGSTESGGSQTLIGSLDVNGAGGNDLGFVRLGAREDGVVFGLAGDGTTLYLFQFKPNGVTVNASLPVADRLTVVDASVTLAGSGVSVANFFNGDICLAGDGNIVALANNGGTTQILTGAPNGSSTTLTKKFDVLDHTGAAFAGSVNGIAFDLQGSLYVSTSGGLYYINKTTVDGPAATINIAPVWIGSNLTDLASNFFPTTIITPVKITEFTVARQGSNAMLNWTTVTEINSDHFEIERSYDGINFTVVGSKLAAGNSSDAVNYQYADPITVNSGNIYYRLKSVDKDAKSSYSQIVVLRLNGGVVKDFTVYPNPFTNDLKIQISSEKESTATIRISNAAGQLLVSRNVTIQKGENILVFSSELQILKPGLHLMEVITEDGKISQKIIKR